MRTLLLRLAGPMQSWGTQSRFTIRDTEREPSKSGVVGLLCAALGRPRTASVDDLAALRMGVRVDHEGTVLVDYQTAGGGRFRGGPYGVVKADGSTGDPVLSSRHYLADADFLVGLEGDGNEQEALLELLDAALAVPVWPLFLGRKAFVPGCPVRLPDDGPLGPGLREGGLTEVLPAYPWPLRRWNEAEPVRFVWEAPAGSDAEVRLDTPLKFVSRERRFAARYVRTTFLAPPAGAAQPPREELT